MSHRGSVGRRPPTTTAVRGEDWYARDLAAERFESVLFADVDLTEARSQGAMFDECTFRGVRFNVSEHTSSAFTNCTFIRCTFFDARFTGCKLTGSVFDACTFGPMHVEHGDWSFVALPGADLRAVRFSEVRMREADLSSVSAQEGSIRDCDLSGAWWQSAKLGGCDLRGSDLSSLDPRAVDLQDAKVTIDQAVHLAQGLGLDVRPDSDR